MDYIVIPLWKSGRVVGHAIVDPEFHWLRQWKWRMSGNGYAMRAVSAAKHGRVIDNIWMHRVVTGCYAWLEVDHINRNKLDNRRRNLRTVSRAENMRNKKTYGSNTSGCAGVSFRKDYGKWFAYVNYNGKRKHLGYFDNKEFAMRAATRARVDLGFLSATGS